MVFGTEIFIVYKGTNFVKKTVFWDPDYIKISLKQSAILSEQFAGFWQKYIGLSIAQKCVKTAIMLPL